MTHRGRLVIIAMLVSLSGVARADHRYDFYLSASGTDANDCLSEGTPCRTFDRIQTMYRVTDPDGIQAHSVVHVVGNVGGASDVSHNHLVTITGPTGIDANGHWTCPDRAAARLDTSLIEDHATVWHTCLTAGQIACRQSGIVDMDEIDFDGSNQVPLVATENCTKINVSNHVSISGPIAVFAGAPDGAWIQIVGDVCNKYPNQRMLYFFVGISGNFNLSGATFSTTPPCLPIVSGYRFYWDGVNATYPTSGGALAIPGHGSIGLNFNNTR